MNITHFGHACVLVEIPRAAASTRILFDPGTYSQDFEDLADLDLILITHAHPDHLDVPRLAALLAANPAAQLIVGEDTLAVLDNPDYPEHMRRPAHVAQPGQKLSVLGHDIVVTGGEHACVHSALPTSENVGYLIDDAVFHPGDAFDEIPVAVDVLLLPIGGPWMKIGEGIDYLRSIAPRVVVPIHQAGLATAHQNMHCQLLKNLAPETTEVRVLDHATSHPISP
ncbi:MBL fold metallo-hydrolase [Nocardia abscessus]|uniref:MBL fold metallo-hydrolase n=1 Tax=Nocardia TaxID=1817 RepID=UPI001893B811|nr:MULTISPECIES: MBL fold metallo-hydrolase [Nocardia]MBF6341157.1 MBL fold metallo-hydrolase [Nocardia abscessus]MDE1674996.1 MBL fold metallo-hydrolase [Nocardia gipuzkoensis]